jgi:hypothetical protein
MLHVRRLLCLVVLAGQLAPAYVDIGLTEAERLREEREIETKMAALETPHTRRVIDAGQILESLGSIWQRANEQERYVDLDRAVVSGLVPKPASGLMFRIAENKEDLTRLCEVGNKTHLERERRDSNPRSSA